mmetsp:Transcript_112215/g.350890  ORF Transcript_112215/g.350890 Transcript_112215/m.350890 type:complete len:134 (-) Transcript_112215:61-462(-)
MAFSRAVLLLVAASLAVGGSAGKVRHSVKTLKGQACRKEAAARRGDQVKVLMSASADTHSESLSSKGAAEQRFIVGRHRIPPINKGVVGMCVGETRRIRVVIEQEPGMESDPMDYVVELLEIDSGRARIKDAL